MTKVGRIIYEEKMEIVYNIAENLIRDGQNLESVSRNTGLDMTTVEALAKKVAEQKAGTVTTTV